MATTDFKPFDAAIANWLTTELNSLANNANSTVSSEFDNTALGALFDALVLSIATQGGARPAGATVIVYIIRAIDGTNYPTINQDCDEVFAVFSLDAATTARPDLTRIGDFGSPAKCKVYVRNQTGQAFASSANLLEHRTFSVESN
jgi:hypothetical protein